MTTMKQNRAFNSRMMTPMIRYAASGGAYDANNDYIENPRVPSKFWGVSVAGNKFSQFDEGQARKPTTGGDRFSTYRSLYVDTRWPSMGMDDLVIYNGVIYNILQKSNEVAFGFNSYLLETPEDTPTIQIMMLANGFSVDVNGLILTVGVL